MLKSRAWAMLFALLPISLTGCTYHEVQNAQRRFRAEYRCKQTRAQHLGAGAVQVEGCDHRVTYLCHGSLCAKERDQSVEFSVPLAQPHTRSAPVAVSRTKHPDGYLLLEFTTQLAEPQTTLSVAGAPQRDAENVLLWFSKTAVSQSQQAGLKTCELRAVVNGQTVVLPEVHHKLQGYGEQLRMKFPVSQLVEWAQAQRIVAQACDVRFEFNEDAMRIVREFLMRFQEELALNGSIPPAKAGTAPGDAL